MISNQLKVRLPARNGLEALEPEGSEVREDLADKILVHSGQGKLSKLSGNPGSLEGCYKFSQTDNALFFKVVPGHFLSQQLQANAYASFVGKAGVRSSIVLEGYPKKLQDDMVLLAYQWLDGRALSSAANELEIFGRSLGLLHCTLQNFPEQQSVQLRTVDRMRVLQTVANEIKSGDGVSTRCISRLRALLCSHPDLFDSFDEPCQVLHGDLNVGNLRWTGKDVVFLDFEDAKHSWFPPRIDVAFALERLILINQADDRLALNNAKVFLKNYSEVFGCSPFIRPGSLEHSLKWLSARSLCMLHHFEQEGEIWPESEWLKFESLLNHIDQRSEMFSEIEASVSG